MSIALDIILAVFIVTGIISGWRKGFVVTVMDLFSFIIAAVGTYLLYPVPADYMYDKLILPQVSKAIESAVTKAGQGQSIGELFALKPDAFTDILDKYSSAVDVESFFNSAEGLTLTDISEYMAAPIARTVSDMLGFLAVLLVLVLLLKLATKLLDRICKLPVLKTANKLLGVAAGAVLGFSLAFISAKTLGTAWPQLSAAYPDVFDPMMMENSVVLKLLYNFDPITLLIKQ